MKKKSIMLSCIAAVAIVAIVGKKTFQSHAFATSNLLMQNVEALSQQEENKKAYTCYNSVTSKNGCQVRYCSTCSYIPGTDTWYAISSTCYK